jgi:hypothetical protein
MLSPEAGSLLFGKNLDAVLTLMKVQVATAGGEEDAAKVSELHISDVFAELSGVPVDIIRDMARGFAFRYPEHVRAVAETMAPLVRCDTGLVDIWLFESSMRRYVEDSQDSEEIAPTDVVVAAAQDERPWRRLPYRERV